MKKFIYVCISIAIAYLIFDILYFTVGVNLNMYGDRPTKTFVKTDETSILLNTGQGYEKFDIKGVNITTGVPGYFATEYAATKEDYLRWFEEIYEMGANTIRVYTILNPEFYEALYEFNTQNEKPLYVIHGIWVNDYVQFSRRDAFDKDFINKFKADSIDLVNVIHGRKKMLSTTDRAGGSYTHDISDWVIGYILGVEWEPTTVEYTNRMREDKKQYKGLYMQTTPDSSSFEAMLASVGDSVIKYETERYGDQRLMSFANWPMADPFDYPENIEYDLEKFTKIDVEHIKTTEKFVSGTFASYHVYPFYPDYLAYMPDVDDYKDKSGKINTYYGYLKQLNEYHTMPVVISEFGLSTSRGMIQKDKFTNRNQGHMSEDKQGKALVECYNDIVSAGCAGAIVFSWQDEWYKQSSNTMHAVDRLKTPYWSDFQTAKQFFGLLTFDPGKEESVCYVDGDIAEWNEEDIIVNNADISLSMKYDEKFIYLLVNKKDYDGEDLYVPIDVTPKTGSDFCRNFGIKFNRDVDFVIKIDGENNSRVMVQERYECLRAMYNREARGFDAYEFTPEPDTSVFKPINMLLQTPTRLITGNPDALSEIYETGKLTHGIANPNSEWYNSLADFYINGDNIEIRLPWQLLNFMDPSEMIIHDDYYENYGVEPLQIESMYVGVGTETIELFEVTLKGWGKNPTYHERLKPAYFDLQEIWREE